MKNSKIQSLKALLQQVGIRVVAPVCAGVVSIAAWAEDAAPAGTAAPAEGADAAASGAPGLMGSLFPIVLMFGIFYFLVIRPQQKRMKDHQKLLSELSHDDEVVTASGILGTVKGITEKVVTLEVASDVRIKVLKSQISQVVKGGQIEDRAPTAS